MSAGQGIARAFSREVVEPLLDSALPGLRLATALSGPGSEVLGLDDEMSQDHDFGPRLHVVVAAEAVGAVEAALDRGLPERFAGRAVRFPTTRSPQRRHHVEVHSPAGLARCTTGVDVVQPRRLLDHVALTGQSVLELTAGPVLRDDAGEMARLRASFAMPDDVRRWAVASAWSRIAEELPFVGRAGDRGDDLGSRLIATRLVRSAMHLGFLLEDRPAPYAKWFGSAFAALPTVGAAAGALRTAVAGASWQQREHALATALDLLARLQERTGLPSLVPPTAPFWDRPFLGLKDLASVTAGTIRDPAVRRLPLVGPPDLWTDDVRILTDHALRRRTTAVLLGLPA